MRKSSVTSLIPLVVVIALSIAACGGEEKKGGGEGAQEAVKIGSIHPLTGPLAADGKQMDAAVKQAVEDINAKGGIKALDGAKLEVESGDSQGKADIGQQEAQRMVDAKVAGIVGTFQSDVTTNVATVAARSQVPLVIDVAVSDEILEQGNKFVFRIQPDASSMGKFGAQYLKQVAEKSGESIEKVAYLHDESEFGSSVVKAFTAQAKSEDLEVVKAIPYDPFGTQDFSTQLAQVKAASPDAMVVTGYLPDGLTIAKNALSAEPPVKVVFGVANGAYSLPSFPEEAGKAGELYFDSNYHFDAKKDRVNEIRDAFKEKSGEEMRTASILSYQAVETIAAALEDASSSEPQAVRDALAKVSIDDPLLTFSGPIEFDEKGQNKNAQPTVMQVQDGKVVQVLPEEFAEAEPELATPWSK